MSQHYSNPKDANHPHRLPDIETFQLTAHEVAARDEDAVYEFMKRREFQLAAMNSHTREAMLDTIVEENGITGGWFYWFVLPGCLPDGDAIGPFATQAEALADARTWANQYGEDE